MSKEEKNVSKDEKSKVVVKPKISLDADVLKAMNTHYSSYLGEEVIGRECFSAPELESHICNIIAKEDGGKKCSKCGNVSSRPCEITCDVHHFCFAAYAVRLGVSVTSKRAGVGAIIHNLRHFKYKGLCEEIMKRREELQSEEEVKESNEKAPNPVDNKSTTHPGIATGELITYTDAAVFLKSSHANIVGYVKRGDLTKINVGAASYIKKAEVLELRKKLDKDNQ